MAGAPVPQRVPGGTILVVSQDPGRRESVARFLEWKLPQARILIASSPSHAGLQARRERIDLLIIDGTSDPAATLAAHASNRKVPCIFLADDPRGISESSVPGPRPAEARPLDYRSLLGQVQRVLRRPRS